MATILVTGGTGLIGSQLCPRLKEKGYEIILLSRRKGSDLYPTFSWNPEKNEIEDGAVESADYIIHLAGTNIGEKRWTLRQKRNIIDSRVKSANLILDKVREKRYPVKAFISSSAVGYYGSEPSESEFSEKDPPGNDFLSEVCIQWEEAADQFQQIGIRTVKIRTGVVLTETGGVLSEMKGSVKSGIGSPLGSGRQYLPWIHIDDLCAIFEKAIEDDQMQGAYNAVAPDDKTNSEFVQLLAKVLKKPYWFPKVPSLILKLILGERASIVLKGNKVSGRKIINEGFNFKYSDLEAALRNLLL
jgi:uncharacterized protein